MVEARIICLAPSVRIPDLDLVMVKDQEAYVDEPVARNSMDLQVLWRTGGVQVHFVERSKTIRPVPAAAPPPPPGTTRRGFSQAAERMDLDIDELARRVAERLTADARPAATNDKIDALLVMVSQLRGDLVVGGNSVQGGAVGMVDEVPTFIPDKLVNEGLGTIDVKSEEAPVGGDLDDAAKALRDMRKKERSK